MRVNMRSYFRRFFVLSFLCWSLSVTAQAGNIGTTTEEFSLVASPTQPLGSDTSSSTTFELSFHLLQTDFLMFYGLTNDEATDLALQDLRKDFSEKFSILKLEYFNKANTILKDKKLSLPDLENSLEDKEKNDSAISGGDNPIKRPIRPAKVLKRVVLPVDQNVKNSTSSSKGGLDPLINLLSATSSEQKKSDGLIRIENRGWFNKLKAWFKS